MSIQEAAKAYQHEMDMAELEKLLKYINKENKKLFAKGGIIKPKAGRSVIVGDD